MSPMYSRDDYVKSLGVKQFAALEMPDDGLPSNMDWEMTSQGPPMKTRPVPGRKCRKCAVQGRMTWIIPGKHCPMCRSEPELVHDSDEESMPDVDFESREGHSERPVPGRKCPGCAASGKTTWVIPGKTCPVCGTNVN